jgi:phospholipid/cholesterol/gamma-HCH transport system substrate-binding protein
MTTDRKQLVVGLVFFASMAILGAYTIMLTGFYKGKRKTFLVNFPQIYGLKEGDRVRAEGLDVGEVKKLRLLETPTGEVRVNGWLDVAANVEIYKESSHVKVTPFSPLGGRIVEIERGYATPAGKYSSVEEMESQSQQVTPIQGEAEGELLSTINKIVEDNKASVNRIVKNLEIVSEKLTRPDSGVIGMLLNDKGAAVKMDEITNEMKDAVSSLNAILARLERGEGVIGELTVKSSKLHQDVGGTFEAARGALGEANTILRRANEGKSALGVFVSEDPRVTSDVRDIAHDLALISGDVRDGKGTVGKVFKDDRLYEGAAVTAENLGKITTRVEAGEGVAGVLLKDPEAARAVKTTLTRLEAIAKSIDEKEGALGLVIKDQTFRDRVGKIFEEVERTVIEFRDSVEDLREQAPINAFLGTVFAAF